MDYETDFSNGLGAEWHTFGGDKFDKANVVVGKSKIALWCRPSADGIWRGAGIGLELPQTYGTYRVHVRADAGKTHVVGLLWPASGIWEAEVDFWEMGSHFVDRQACSQTLHYFPGNHQVRKAYDDDFTTWQTIGVEWREGYLEFTDHSAVRSVIAQPEVPNVPMKLHIQTAMETDGTIPDAPTKVEISYAGVSA